MGERKTIDRVEEVGLFGGVSDPGRVIEVADKLGVDAVAAARYVRDRRYATKPRGRFNRAYASNEVLMTGAEIPSRFDGTDSYRVRRESIADALDAVAWYSDETAPVVAASVYERAGRVRAEIDARGLGGVDAMAASAIRLIRDAGLAVGVFDVVEVGTPTSRDGVLHREFEVRA